MLWLRRVAISLLFSTLLISPLSAQQFTVGHIGVIATRGYVPSMIDNTNLQFNSQQCQFMRTSGVSLQIVVPNWYVVQGGAETNSGGTLTLTAAANDNGGTLTAFKWGGNSSIVIANGANGIPDPLTLSYSAGDTVCIRLFGTASAGRVYSINNLTTALGDALNVAPSGLSDLTLGGTITTNASPNFFGPVAIIGQTPQPTVAIIGDSICHGTGDTVDSTGDMGSIARSVGPTFAYMNLCVGSDEAHLFVASHSKRAALVSAYATSLINAEGRNDLNASRTAAQLEADMSTIAGLFPTIATQIATTIVPTSSPAGSCTTPGTDQAARTTYNTAVRANLSWASFFSEIGAVLETSLNNDIWIGTANQYTADCVHPNHAAELSFILGTTNPAWIH